MSGLRRWKNLGYVIAPLAFAILSITSTAQKSPTYDEAVHLFAGYSYLKWGDFRVNPEHPPLGKMLAAVPLLVLEPDTSGITPLERYKVQQDKNYGWVLAHRLVFANNDADTLFLYARLVMVTMAMGLALWVALWTWELYGAFAASVALILFCADPNLIAHSAIVQTDFPFALFFFGSMYFFGRTLSNLAWSNLLMTAALFSAAVVTKFSAFIILPIWLALGLIRIVQLEPIHSSILDPPKITGRWAKTASIAAIVMLGVTFAYLSIWLIYQLRFDAIVLQRGELPTGNLSLDSLSNFILSVAREYMLLPEALLFGLGDAYQRMGRTAYLLGEISPNGFWLYFPVAFLVKTPVPTLLIIILAIVYQLTSRRPKVSGTHFLLVPVVTLFCFAIWSRLNVGWRHILPMYPLLFVWLGGMVSVMWRSERRSTRLVLFCLGVWLVASTLLAYPNYLAYFNEAAGGSKNGRSILVDSNLDWGQDLKALKNWMTHNQIGKIQFAYFGTADPAYYKIDSVYLPGSVFVTDEGIHGHERPRYVAMSETLLAGLYLDKPDRYAQFRQREPVAIIGHSIRVFKLADEEQIE